VAIYARRRGDVDDPGRRLERTITSTAGTSQDPARE
jgi:hypothetical protein